MDKAEIAAKLAAHKEWLADSECGEKLCLSRADLRWAELSGSDLRWADLRWSDLRWADLRKAVLRGARLSEAELHGVDLSGSDLRWADLRWADLRDTNLRDANLREAEIQGADLRGATGFILLPVVDMRGYSFAHAVLCDDGWRVRVGCRDFTIDEALEHWGESYEGDREQGGLYLYAVNWLKAKLENER